MSFGLRGTLLDREAWHHQRRAAGFFGLGRPRPPGVAPAERFTTEFSAVLLGPAQRSRVEVLDLSITGVRVRAAVPLAAGLLTRIVLPSGRAKHVRVIWHNDGEAGLEFLAALGEGEVRTLLTPAERAE